MKELKLLIISIILLFLNPGQSSGHDNPPSSTIGATAHSAHGDGPYYTSVWYRGPFYAPYLGNWCPTTGPNAGQYCLKYPNVLARNFLSPMGTYSEDGVFNLDGDSYAFEGPWPPDPAGPPGGFTLGGNIAILQPGETAYWNISHPSWDNATNNGLLGTGDWFPSVRYTASNPSEYSPGTAGQYCWVHGEDDGAGAETFLKDPGSLNVVDGGTGEEKRLGTRYWKDDWKNTSLLKNPDYDAIGQNRDRYDHIHGCTSAPLYIASTSALVCVNGSGVRRLGWSAPYSNGPLEVGGPGSGEWSSQEDMDQAKLIPGAVEAGSISGDVEVEVRMCVSGYTKYWAGAHIGIESNDTNRACTVNNSIKLAKIVQADDGSTTCVEASAPGGKHGHSIGGQIIYVGIVAGHDGKIGSAVDGDEKPTIMVKAIGN